MHEIHYKSGQLEELSCYLVWIRPYVLVGFHFLLLYFSDIKFNIRNNWYTEHKLQKNSTDDETLEHFWASYSLHCVDDGDGDIEISLCPNYAQFWSKERATKQKSPLSTVIQFSWKYQRKGKIPFHILATWTGTATLPQFSSLLILPFLSKTSLYTIYLS